MKGKQNVINRNSFVTNKLWLICMIMIVTIISLGANTNSNANSNTKNKTKIIRTKAKARAKTKTRAKTKAKAKTSKWRHSVGVNLRALGDIDLKGGDVTPGNTTFINGSVVDVGAGNFTYTVVDSVLQIDNATLDTVEYQKAFIVDQSVDLDDSVGLAISTRRTIGSKDKFIFEFDLSLTTTFVSDDVSASGTTKAFEFNIAPNTWTNANAPNPGGGPDPNTKQQIFAIINQSQILTATNPITAMVNYDLDVDLYTFGCGFNIGYTCKKLQLKMSAGPTLTLVDADVSRRTTAGFTGGTTFFNNKKNDDDFVVRGGAYALVGLQCDLGKSWGIGVAGRYDYVAVDVDTDIADFDLDGFSGQLYLDFEF